MYFQQHYLGCLAHASYLIGSEGVAAVVDPRRDVEVYLEDAARNGLRIAHVIETHLHADFVSGHRELAERTGAQIHIGRRAGAAFPHVAVADGDVLAFGRCLLRFLETPGHTPEGISILVTDLDRAPDPFAVLTGDTLFIGDVGRPDLSKEHTPLELAGLLYDSLHEKLLTLSDAVEVWPAHGAGSLCGRNISSDRSSTIGHERTFNHALQPMSRDEFARTMTADLPERPGYFASDAEINRAGAPSLATLGPLTALSPADVEHAAGAGAVVLDTRAADAFGAGHVPGSLHIGLSGQFASWAGTLLGVGARLVLVAEGREQVDEARTRLARVGMEGIAGFLDGGVASWAASGRPVATVPQVPPDELAARLRESAALRVLDVRRPSEWEAGHMERATLVPLNNLPARLGVLERNGPVAVHCKSGYRSSIAASLLLRAGFRDVLNVPGGLDAWQARGLPCEIGAAATLPG